MPDMDDHVARSLDSLKLTIDAMRSDMVSKEFYREARKADQHLISEVAADVAEMRENSKWLFRAFVSGVLMVVAGNLILIWVTQQVFK